MHQGKEEITYKEINDPSVMAKNPMVSVKMLTYNHEPYIAQAIEGVVMQDCNFSFELIIGEDCSLDNTRDIVLKYQRQHPDKIRVVAWDKNIGVRRNSQTVDRLARGKYIAWCEGDDYWTHPKKLQIQVDIMEADPEIGLVHGGADAFIVKSGKHEPWIRKSVNYYSDGNVFNRLLTSDYDISTLTMLVRRDYYNTIFSNHPSFFERRFRAGDLLIKLLISKDYRVVHVNELLATRHILAESASHSENMDKMVSFLENTLELRILIWQTFSHNSLIKNEILKKHFEALLGLSYRHSACSIALDTLMRARDNHISLSLKHYLFFYGAKYKTFSHILTYGNQLRLLFKAIWKALDSQHKNLAFSKRTCAR